MRTTTKLTIAGLAVLTLLAGAIAWIRTEVARPTALSPRNGAVAPQEAHRDALGKPGSGASVVIQRGMRVATSTAAPAPEPGSTTGRLHVHVVAALDEHPLADVAVVVGHSPIDQPSARIGIVRGDEPLCTLRTDAGGNAECELPAGSMYSATALVEMEGTSCHTTRWAQIGSDQTSELEIRAGSGVNARCKGTVIDRDTGLPIGGATVSRMDGGMAVTTSALGEFALDTSASWYERNLHVDADGYCPVLAHLHTLERTPRVGRQTRRPTRGARSAVTRNEPERGLTVFLRREAFLDGWLLDPAGSPVAETRVHAECVEESFGEAFDVPVVMTDDKGHFDFGRVPSGVVLSVGPKMSGTRATEVTLGPEEKRTLTVRAQPYVELSGRVLDEHDEPIVEGGVSARCGDRTDDGTIRSDGTYYLPFLGPGRGTINVGRGTPGNSGHYSCALEIPEGVTEWTLDLRPTLKRSIKGRVVAADGGAVVEGQVELVGPFGATEVVPTEDGGTKEDGTFEFLGLMPGTYEVSCMAFETHIRSDKVRVVAGDGPVELRMPAEGSIRGRVRSAPGLASKLDAVQVDVLGTAISAGIEEDGTFMARVPLGRMSIVAHGDELTSAIVSVDVRAGEETVLPDFVMEGTASLRLLAGRVEHGATYEIRRGDDTFAAGSLASNADQVITVPCGTLRVILVNEGKGEAHEVTLAAGELKWLAVLRTP